jgi:hypothetical protein
MSGDRKRPPRKGASAFGSPTASACGASGSQRWQEAVPHNLHVDPGRVSDVADEDLVVDQENPGGPDQLQRVS